MSLINSALPAAFESTLMSASNCNILPSRPLHVRLISNRADIVLAVKEIYFHQNTLWAHARGGKGRRKLTNTGSVAEFVEMLLETIGGRIFMYFNAPANVSNTQENFDNFHNSLCNDFLRGINAIRSGVGYVPMSYGQAQKLINLSFKYLSCYQDYSVYADLFEHCHMVIDYQVLIILGGSSNLSTMLGVSIPSSITGLSGGRFMGKGWTDFLDTDYFALLNEYRRVIDPYKGNISYMELEHSMWPTVHPVVTTGLTPTSISGFHI